MVIAFATVGIGRAVEGGMRSDLQPASGTAFSTSPPYDVIVIGARVAGAATSMLLARRGVRVLVLERAPRPGCDTLSTHALMRAGVLQLYRWGLLDRVVDANTPPVRTTVLHYGDDIEVVQLKERLGMSRLYGPRRTVLDPILMDAASEAGADIRFGTTITNLLSRDGRVVGVEGRDRHGRPFEVRAPLVIGADGLRSLVARQGNARATWEGRSASGMIYGYFEGLDVDGYEWHYRPGVSAGFIPTNDGQVCVWVGAPADRFHRELRQNLEAGFDQLLREAAPDQVRAIGAARRTGHLRGFPGARGYLRRPWGPGWALVGDAGSFRDPLSAHGISDALRDAELLPRAVLIALGADEKQRVEALADYERRRDEVALPMARCTDAIASYQWTLPEVRDHLLAFSKVMGREVEMIEALDHVDLAAA